MMNVLISHKQGSCDKEECWRKKSLGIDRKEVDIEKAFLHIKFDVIDRDVTRLFWLQNPKNLNSRLIAYKFKVVLFDATCSTFILSATLMTHF